MDHVLVAGAGIVGVSTAIWLQRAGFRVTLVDKSGPAAAASFGNAGILAAGALEPTASPGLLRNLPRMLLSPDGPIFARWSYVPRALPWIVKFLSHATPGHAEHYAAAMATLILDSVDQHRALAQGTGAERYIHDDDWCFGYPTRAAFEADARGWDLRKRNGVVFSVVTGADFARFDPLFEDAFEVVVRCHNHGRISDPGAYIRALFDHFLAEGGAFEQAKIEDVILAEGRIKGLICDGRDVQADGVVLAMGAWSKPLAAKMGVTLPLETERGYHIEYVNPSAYPRCTTMVTQGKFAMSPMEGRIRCAGTVEIGGLTEAKSRGPLALLRRQSAAVLGNLDYERIDEWVGHRPTLANDLPALGVTPDHDNAFLALGHQHLGLTGGPKSGRIVADLIAGRRPNIDIEPFSPSQYR